MTLYIPPSLTNKEQGQALTVARKIHNLHDMKKRLYYIVALVTENMRLTNEVNDLRDRLGIPPMKSYPADETKI